jgi:hypothetical protein
MGGDWHRCHDTQTKFHNNLSSCSKVDGEIHRQHDDCINLLSCFQNKESKIIKIYFLLHKEHTSRYYKTKGSILFREIIALYYDNYTVGEAKSFRNAQESRAFSNRWILKG